jgi:hypothetical protein
MFQELSGRQNVIALDGKNNTQNEKTNAKLVANKEISFFCSIYMPHVSNA